LTCGIFDQPKSSFMRLPTYIHLFLFAGFFLVASDSSKSASLIQQKNSQQDPLLGDWSGTSLCQVKNSPCHDEKVVFHFAPGASAGLYKVKADKIVNGQLDNMGELDFTLNRATNTLTCVLPNGTWLLVVDKKHIEGTLTTPDKVLYRKLSLAKAG
jgi:hypothetical protein